MLPLDIPTDSILKWQVFLRATEFRISDEAFTSSIASRNSSIKNYYLESIETPISLILDFLHKLRSVTVSKIHY